VRRAGPIGRRWYGIIGRVERGTQDGVCTVADKKPPLLPRRRPPGELMAEPFAEDGADPPRALPDLNVLRQVLAGLRRLD
jgi:hypothetical protein